MMRVAWILGFMGIISFQFTDSLFAHILGVTLFYSYADPFCSLSSIYASETMGKKLKNFTQSSIGIYMALGGIV